MTVSSTFTTTHEFHLLDGTIVQVQAELLGDWVAYEADGTRWSTNMGDTHPEWFCGPRTVQQLSRVVKYGHRFSVYTNCKSHRFVCECGKQGSWVRSDERAAEYGVKHHRDAVRV